MFTLSLSFTRLMEGGWVYQVAGSIGVGKTMLLESAAREGCNTFPEILIQKQFVDYIKEPREHAYDFQIAMMQAACMRTVCARLMQNFLSTTTVVERGAQENKIFAMANYAMGWMTTKQYECYLGYVDDILNQNKLLPILDRSVQVFLWAPKHDLASRMDERARPGEEEYKEDYLSRLDEAYFAHILDSHVAGEYKLPYHVIDWRTYGTWKDVLRGVNSRHHCSDRIYYVAHDAGLQELFIDNTEAWRLMGDAQLADEALKLGVNDPNFLRYRHRGVHKRFDSNGLHLDLSWYINADVATNAFALAFYRDLVYEALAAGLDVHFHYHAKGDELQPPECLLTKLRQLGASRNLPRITSASCWIDDNKYTF